ncbi:MAG: lipoyl protein ligase domain-containing protein [Planctomycetaceae bacterium]
MSTHTDEIWQQAGGDALDVYLLGLVDFDAAQVLQQQLSNELRTRVDRRAICLVCEHPPLISMGREGSRSQILCEPGDLAARQIDVRWMNRGGGALMHAAGQVAMYPLVPLDRLGLSVAALRDLLTRVAISACTEQRLRAEAFPATGSIATRGGQVGQVGLSVRSGLSRQGLFLNVNPSPRLYQLVDAGLGRQTSIAEDRQRPIHISSVRECLVRRLAQELGFSRFHVFTGHPLLRQTRRLVTYA